MFDFTEKVIKKDGIVNSIGEIVLEPSVITVKERANVPFRSITDLKGYSDNEVFVEPTNTDVTGYVDNRVVIDKIMSNVPLDVLSIFGQQMAKNSDEFDDDDIQDDFADHEDELDIVTQANQLSGAIAEAQSKNQTNKSTSEVKEERSVASDDATSE